MEDAQQDRLTEEALRWFVLLREEAAEADRQAFAAWLARGPAHEAAWRRAHHVWSHADRLEPMLRRQRPASTVAPSRRSWLKAAAGIAVVVGAGTGAYVLSDPACFSDHSTGIGERRAVTLADGSVVELASASAISVSYAGTIRQVTLHEGEAFFTVAPDAAKPFVVVAGTGRTRALGTAFDVKRAGSMVTVAVTEHAVQVSLDDGASAQVAERQQVAYGPAGLAPVGPADPDAVGAWRRDRLVFQDAPLESVIAELNRYRHGRILITDGRLRALPVTAVFDTRQTDAALQTIGQALPVRIRKLTDMLVLLSARG